MLCWSHIPHCWKSHALAQIVCFGYSCEQAHEILKHIASALARAFASHIYIGQNIRFLAPLYSCAHIHLKSDFMNMLLVPKSQELL